MYTVSLDVVMPDAAASLPDSTTPLPLTTRPKVSGWNTVPSVKPGAASPLRMTMDLPEGPIHMTAPLLAAVPEVITPPPVKLDQTRALPSLLTYWGEPADTDIVNPLNTSPPRYRM